jgi:hypothetical protein
MKTIFDYDTTILLEMLVLCIAGLCLTFGVYKLRYEVKEYKKEVERIKTDIRRLNNNIEV